MATANTLSAEMQTQLRRFEFVLERAKPALLYAVRLHTLPELVQSVNDYRRRVIYVNCGRDDMAIVLQPFCQDFGGFDEKDATDSMVIKKRAILLSHFGKIVILEKSFSQIGTTMAEEIYDLFVRNVDLSCLGHLARDIDAVARLIVSLQVLLKRECAIHRQREETIIRALHEGEIGLLDRDLFDAGELTGFK